MITLTYIKSKILQDCLTIKLRPSMNKIHRYKLDSDIMKRCLQCIPKMNFLRQSFQKLKYCRHMQLKNYHALLASDN